MAVDSRSNLMEFLCEGMSKALCDVAAQRRGSRREVGGLTLTLEFRVSQ